MPGSLVISVIVTLFVLGTQTDVTTPAEMKDSWTQYEDQLPTNQMIAEGAEADMEVGPVEDDDDDDDEIEEEPDDPKKDADYNPLNEIGCDKPCRPELISDM